jgi:predicted transcriptional regulator
MGNQMEIPPPAELRAKRSQMGLKQADVARMAGISQSMVARSEAGSVDPRVSTLQRS